MLLFSLRNTTILLFAMLLVFAAILFAMGRTPICTCGYVKFWQQEVTSAENSQHLADWYTFSHIIHGFGFYALLWFVSRRFFAKRGGLPMGAQFLAAVVFEIVWEILENSPWIINYYRQNTVSLGYVGDSIVNSVGDVLFMAFGFYLARTLPVWATVSLAVAMEFLAAFVIRDNLTLNILMFIYPFQAVKEWQLGA